VLLALPSIPDTKEDVDKEPLKPPPVEYLSIVDLGLIA
jgi:hypothetical protein